MQFKIGQQVTIKYTGIKDLEDSFNGIKAIIIKINKGNDTVLLKHEPVRVVYSCYLKTETCWPINCIDIINKQLFLFEMD